MVHVTYLQPTQLSGTYVHTYEESRTYGEMRVDLGIRRPLRFEHR